MELKALTRRLQEHGLLRKTVGIADGMEVDRLVSDSREATPGSLFVAVRGTTSDGHLFIDKAVNNGARAVVCEAVPERVAEGHPGTAIMEVTDARAALAEAAAEFYADPSRDLRMVGITGTNGKTTTAFLMHHTLNALGSRCGLIGTIQIDLGEEPTPATLTTPDAISLQRSLRTMRDNGCIACAMEASSHALDQQRVRAVDFDVGVFTNLTPEHLDYHETMEAYRDAKKRLFDDLSPDAAAVFNIDDLYGASVVADSPARRISYGQTSDATIQLEVEANTLAGLHLALDGQRGRFRLVGLFNAYNLAAAYAAAVALGHDGASVFQALRDAPPVPGRFEQIRVSRGRTVVVDYAHTPDALQNVLETTAALRPPGAAIWCVFGCGGDRDRAKRPAMGAIAERLADRVIVTSDNPRTEDPESILLEIRAGMTRPERVQWIVDRRAAIDTAAASSDTGDIIVIAGKGHETYQVVGETRSSFDDREEARRAFA